MLILVDFSGVFVRVGLDLAFFFVILRAFLLINAKSIDTRHVVSCSLRRH